MKSAIKVDDEIKLLKKACWGSSAVRINFALCVDAIQAHCGRSPAALKATGSDFSSLERENKSEYPFLRFPEFIHLWKETKHSRISLVEKIAAVNS